MTRREFVRIAAGIAAATAVARSNAEPSRAIPGMELRRLPYGAVRPRGWMLAQMRRDLDHGFAGCLDTLSPHVANDLFVHRVHSANGQLAWWDAESRGNWLWGYTLLAHLADAPAHQARADLLVRSLRETQDDDGYIGIHDVAARYRTGDTENGELWAQSRALAAMLTHHELTGDMTSLDAARRAIHLTRAQYGRSRSPFGRESTTGDRTGVTHGLCFIDALQMLQEATGELQYANFAVELRQAFDAWTAPFPNDDLAAANLAQPWLGLRGHAVHTAEHMRSLVALQDDVAESIARAMHKVRCSTTPAGALIGDESLHGLPHPQAAYEYCTLTELAFSLARLAQFTGDPALGDWLERLVFNPAQGARQPDGRAIAYLSTDTRIDATAARPDSYSMLNGRHGRFKLSPTHDDVACCCNPNSLRILPQFVASSWMARADGTGIVALAYGPGELRTAIDGQSVRVVQVTDYPFEDTVRFTVDVPVPVRLGVWLRRPGWARSCRVTGLESSEIDGWIVIDRTWSGRAEFALQFDLPVHGERYPGGELAVMRGPLQFVQPVRHHASELPVAGREGWPDFELLPDPDDLGTATPVLDPAQPDLGFVVERIATDVPDFPWSASPVRLHGHGTTLVPMGCAQLRRANFNAVPDSRGSA